MSPWSFSVLIESMKNRPVILVLSLLVLTAGAAWLWPLQDTPVRVPDISVTSLTGETLRLAELRGRPVLINFWATSCHSCMDELPHLIELYRALAPRGLEIIAVAMPYDPPDRVLAVSRAKRIPYPVALDIRGETARAFGGIGVTPTSFLVAGNGEIIERIVGALDLERLHERIEPDLTPPHGRTTQGTDDVMG
jgi:thiol-disulfide isomerase/thioredoxin